MWIKDGGHLLFSDIPRNAVMRWKEGDGLSQFMKPSGYTGVADYGPSRQQRIDARPGRPSGNV